ncbi:cytochrome P450 [Rhodococcus wratislaviensis]|nr:cytochrome P450 [Rhodococcus wratislaviensis]
MTDSNQAPAYPMPRARACPFDPPPGLTELESVQRVRIWDGSMPWLVKGYDDSRRILSDPRVSNDVRREGYPHTSEPFKALRTKGVVTFDRMDSPEHERQRRMLTKDFMVKHIEQMRPKLQHYVDELMDAILAGPNPVDLVPALALPLPGLVICELLGVPFADTALFQRCVSRMLNTKLSPEVVMDASKELHDYLENLVRASETEPADGLIGRLVSNQMANGELTRTQIVDMSLLLLMAGYDTSSNMISLGILALLQNPDQLADLRESDDPALTANTVEELLRYLTVLHMGRRRLAMEDIELGGQTIRAGDGIIVLSDMANRDNTAFAGDPNELDIHRDARHNVAFGFGVHQCLGQPLARVELQIVYSTFAKRMPSTVKLAIPFEDVKFQFDAQIYGLDSLPVTW